MLIFIKMQSKDESLIFYLYLAFLDIGHDINLMGAINNISFTYPPFSLLTQPEEVSDSLFCDENNIPAHCIDKPQCPCIYRIKVSLNSTVELVIVDESAGNFFLKS